MTVDNKFYFPIEKEIGSRVTHVTPGVSLRERLAAARQKAVVEPPTVEFPEFTAPDSQFITCQVDSKVLDRVVDMVLDQRKPDDVIFDGVAYTIDELRQLKNLDRESLIAAHNVKREFQAEVMP